MSKTGWAHITEVTLNGFRYIGAPFHKMVCLGEQAVVQFPLADTVSRLAQVEDGRQNLPSCFQQQRVGFLQEPVQCKPKKLQRCCLSHDT